MANSGESASRLKCPACDYGPFTRNFYFTGKLLLERDFNDEQRYVIEKFLHHHQRLHGWGVVCGLKVKEHPNPACQSRFVCIEPGTALDCCGHEIFVPREECLDITKLEAFQALKKEKEEGEVTPHTLQVCVRYRECPTEEIPVLFDECGCDETRCAPNRMLESYEFDLIVNPKDKPEALRQPSLKWEHETKVAHASRAALHGVTRRLYVMTAGEAGTLHQVSTDNHVILASHALAQPGLALAVANDGSRLYVALQGATPADPGQLMVFDLTAPSVFGTVLHTLEIAGSAGSEVNLAVAPAPDNRLLALAAKTGKVSVWGTDLNSPAVPQPPKEIDFPGPLQDLVIGSAAAQAYVADPTNRQVQVLNLATLDKGTPIEGFPATSSPSALVLAATPSGDSLGVLDAAGKKLYLVNLEPPPALVGTPVALDHKPRKAVSAPGGRWVNILADEDGGSGSFLQAVNVQRLKEGAQVEPGEPVKVGDGGQDLALTPSGRRLYVPYLGDPEVATDGGVAILEGNDQACAELFWRHLEGCPSCDTPKCVVLATVDNYRLDDLLKDQTDPPADTAVDARNHVARIDNRQGRRLLPSTQVLAEALECLLEQCLNVPAPGAVAPPVPELTHIVAVNWPHAGEMDRNTLKKDGLLVAFDQPVLRKDINFNSFRVLVPEPKKFVRGVDAICWRELQVKKVMGVNVTLPPNPWQPRVPAGRVQEVNGAQCFLASPDNLPLNITYRVIVKGDLIRDNRGYCLDADHLPDRWPNRLSGNGAEGGDFESWFTLIEPRE